MKHAQIILGGKVIAETQDAKPDEHAAAVWAHLMGWNVDWYDSSKGKLSSDCGTKHATLRIFDGCDNAV